MRFECTSLWWWRSFGWHFFPITWISFDIIIISLRAFCRARSSGVPALMHWNWGRATVVKSNKMSLLMNKPGNYIRPKLATVWAFRFDVTFLLPNGKLSRINFHSFLYTVRRNINSLQFTLLLSPLPISQPISTVCNCRGTCRTQSYEINNISATAVAYMWNVHILIYKYFIILLMAIICRGELMSVTGVVVERH